MDLLGLRTWFGYSDYAHNELDFDAAEGHDTVGSRFTNKQFEGRIEAESVPLATAFGPLAIDGRTSRSAIAGSSA